MQSKTEDLLLQLADVSARLEQLRKLVQLPIAHDPSIREGLDSTISHLEDEKIRLEASLGKLGAGGTH